MSTLPPMRGHSPLSACSTPSGPPFQARGPAAGTPPPLGSREAFAGFRTAGLLPTGTLLLAGLLAAFLTPTSLRADGGTLRAANVPMGAYRVNVFTDPTPITPDSVDVSVLVTFERGRGVARGLEILVVATKLDGSGTQIRHPATRDQAEDPRYYAAKFRPGAVGEWEIRVHLQGSEGEGEVAFQVEVREPGLFQNPFLILTLAFLPLLLVGAWLKLSSGASRK